MKKEVKLVTITCDECQKPIYPNNGDMIEFQGVLRKVGVCDDAEEKTPGFSFFEDSDLFRSTIKSTKADDRDQFSDLYEVEHLHVDCLIRCIQNR